MDLDELEARGLYDPKAPTAADRLELLEWFEQRGITVEQMVRARDRNRLRSAAGDALLRPGERLTVAEVSEQVGVPVDEIERLSRIVGLPVDRTDGPVHTPADAEVMQLYPLARDLFRGRSSEQLMRVIGSALGRIADAAVALFLADIETPIVESRGSELDHAKAQVEAMEILNVLPGVMETLFRAHIENAIDRNQAARVEATSLLTVHVAVGFVDLVGFTSFSRQVPVTELGAAISEFEDVAYDTIATHGGQLVKLIGDEVMFVALDARAACEIGLAMIESFGDDSNVKPHGGVALGEVLTRGGDYYGPVVNQASRLCDLAVPQEILVTEEVRDRVGGGTGSIGFDPAGRRMLKGFDVPLELYALARQSGAGTT